MRGHWLAYRDSDEGQFLLDLEMLEGGVGAKRGGDLCELGQGPAVKLPEQSKTREPKLLEAILESLNLGKRHVEIAAQDPDIGESTGNEVQGRVGVDVQGGDAAHVSGLGDELFKERHGEAVEADKLQLEHLQTAHLANDGSQHSGHGDVKSRGGQVGRLGGEDSDLETSKLVR